MIAVAAAERLAKVPTLVIHWYACLLIGELLLAGCNRGFDGGLGAGRFLQLTLLI